MLILTGTKSSILLFDEEEGGCLQRLRWADFSRMEVFIDEGIGSFLFIDGKGVESSNF